MDPLTLDGLDKQLAHALQVDGRAPFSRIADVLGTSDRTVARRYRRLRSAGVLRVVGLPHASALGLVDWLVRMRCTPDAAVPVSTALARRADTSWVTVLSGGTEVTCITRTHADSEEGELLLQKLPRTRGITGVTAHCMLRSVAGTSGWPGRTAALTPAQVALLEPTAEPADVTADATDNDLFAALARDGRASLPVLARATRWSESTVRRRLTDLRRGGVLYFDVDIAASLFGFRVEATLWLTVAPTVLTTVTRALAAHPQVAYAAAITGQANIAAVVACRDLPELYDYLATGVGSLDGVHAAEVATTVRRVKSAGPLLF